MGHGAEYDLIVIGAGAAGLSGARLAARLGARVALVERDKIGGDCTWRGCVPSKSLLSVARRARAAIDGRARGLLVGELRANFMAARGFLDETRAHIGAAEDRSVLSREGIDVVLGAAQFVDAHTIEVDGRQLRARRFLLAVGSTPAVPPIQGLMGTPYLTSDTVFDIEHAPRRLCIVGAGPIGVELAQAFANLSIEVVLIGERVLPKDEPEAQELIERVLEKHGVIRVRKKAERVSYADARFTVHAQGEEAYGDALLVAAGRAVHVESLALDVAGVEVNERGVVVDDSLRTKAKHIYAVGDCIDGPKFTHAAGWQAAHAVRNALFPGRRRGLLRDVPWVTYTEPEVAHAGLTEAEARRRFHDRVRVSRIDLEHVDRAICEGEREGFVKLVFDARTNKVVGATVVASRAGEVVSELALAIELGVDASTLANTVHPYPTFSGAIQQAAMGATLEALEGGLLGKIARRWTARRARAGARRVERSRAAQKGLNVP